MLFIEFISINIILSIAYWIEDVRKVITIYINIKNDTKLKIYLGIMIHKIKNTLLAKQINEMMRLCET